MGIRLAVVCAAVVVCAAAGVAGEQDVRRALFRSASDLPLTGNLRVDLRTAGGPAASVQEPLTETPEPPGRKSPWLAAGLSLVVPGAGEAYAESYWKGALFLAADVAAWTVAYTQDRKGDDQTAFFQAFADQHWSVRKYARWSYDNYGQVNSSVDTASFAGMFLPDGRIDWDVLNAYERALGNWYSHTLPPYGAQQYYELIGKYQQFYHGWDDANPALLTYDDISRELSPNFRYYSVERGKANDYYSRASTAVTIAIVLRIVSAIDAAWTAASYNSRIEAGMSSHTVPFGPGTVSVPAARVAYRF